MKLIHYSEEPFQFEYRQYEQDIQYKPRGLWFDIEGPDVNKTWFEYDMDNWTDGIYGSERLKISSKPPRLTYQTKVSIKDGANILELKDWNDIVKLKEEFGTEYQLPADYKDRYKQAYTSWLYTEEIVDASLYPEYKTDSDTLSLPSYTLIEPTLEEEGGIDWAKVSEKYQGILVKPFHSVDLREPGFFWYRTFDCCGGCVWDLDAIEIER